MKLVLVFALCLLICYIHTTSSESSGAKKQASTKDKVKKPDNVHSKAKDKTKAHGKPPINRDGTKEKRTPQIRTPFDKVLDKLSKCALSSSASPSLIEVMEENLKELQTDEKYRSLFNAAPHVATFLKKQRKDSSKFIPGLQQALNADWSNPAWKSADEIETLFRPLKQQFVYAMMRFNCTS
ncbi:hypothetical protein I4U23_027837 [Adineta vaga]|nr:hypothetical protein I4U23_027837 [Adineta vaga]